MTDLIEVKLSDATPSAYLHRMAERFAPARAVQIVGELRQPAQHGRSRWRGRRRGWGAGGVGGHTPPACRLPRVFAKRIDDSQLLVDHLPVLQVFGQQGVAARFQRGGDDLAVPEQGDAPSLLTRRQVRWPLRPVFGFNPRRLLSEAHDTTNATSLLPAFRRNWYIAVFCTAGAVGELGKNPPRTSPDEVPAESPLLRQLYAGSAVRPAASRSVDASGRPFRMAVPQVSRKTLPLRSSGDHSLLHPPTWSAGGDKAGWRVWRLDGESSRLFILC